MLRTLYAPLVVVTATALSLAALGLSPARVPTVASVANTSAIKPAVPLHISASFLSGTTSLLVKGTATSGVPVELSLLATFDPDIPVVVVARAFVVAGPDNQFRTVLTYAPASASIATLSVQATAAGMQAATACCFRPGSAPLTQQHMTSSSTTGGDQ